MRQVFSSTAEVCNVFANQTQDFGRNGSGNVYFDGDTIYSYGRHFPIAKIVGCMALYNLNGYSNTTAHHKSDVYRALIKKGYEIVGCYSFNPSKNYADWKYNLDNLYKKLTRARNPERYITAFKNQKEQIAKFEEISQTYAPDSICELFCKFEDFASCEK